MHNANNSEATGKVRRTMGFSGFLVVQTFNCQAYHKMLSMLAPLSKAELIEQLRIAYENFARENQDVTLTAPVLLLVGDQDCTGKVKSYCKAWAKQTGCTLHYIKNINR
ncbi:hypothetical protein C804_02657 [Lachnospiraceae bacterium A4]|nr:hypothetical protein C804_02657 [Lachnospiraceae bacterium A4]